jgi:hypothetical protein
MNTSPAPNLIVARTQLLSVRAWYFMPIDCKIANRDEAGVFPP